MTSELPVDSLESFEEALGAGRPVVLYLRSGTARFDGIAEALRHEYGGRARMVVVEGEACSGLAARFGFPSWGIAVFDRGEPLVHIEPLNLSKRKVLDVVAELLPQPA